MTKAKQVFTADPSAEELEIYARDPAAGEKLYRANRGIAQNAKPEEVATAIAALNTKEG